MTVKYTKNFALALPDFRQGPWHDLINSDFEQLDSLIFGAMSQANVVPWLNSKSYTVGETLLDSTDATVWMCAVAHTSAAAPTTFAQDRTNHPTYWTRLLTGFAPRGEWAQNTQYFPYDLVYDSGRGIMALGQIRHISTNTGSIIDDEANWAFLLDMSDVGLVVATAVTYSNSASPTINADNVQDALDVIENQIVLMNNVNITQGTQITTATNVNNTQNTDISNLTTRMNNVESANTTQNSQIGTHTSQISAMQTQINGINQGMPTGTIMCFFQQYPPTGWNLVNGWSDRALRIFDGGGGGGTAGGAVGWSGVFARTATDGHVLTVGQLASHGHTTDGVKFPSAGTGGFAATSGFAFPVVAAGVGASGGNEAHAHNVEMRLAYIGVCIGQKA